MGLFDSIFNVKDKIGNGGIIGNSGVDLRDSYEKKCQAREYINQAKQYVREGNDIYDKAYSKVSSYAAETEYQLYQHCDYKKRIARELGGSVSEVLNNFSKFSIDAKVIETPSINTNDKKIDVDIFRSTVSSCISNDKIGSIFDIWISDVDYYEAKRQKQEAKLFKERMKAEREKLYAYKEKMSEIRRFISSEKNEIDSIMGKVNKMTNELNCGMKKESFTCQEAEYLKAIHKITEMLSDLLSTEFLSASFSITTKYQGLYDKIKMINQELPIAPSINDSTTLDAIKIILESTVVY